MVEEKVKDLAADALVTFGANVRRIRKQMGQTLDELSRARGGSPTPSEISRLERGLLPNASYATLCPIAEALGKTVDELAGGGGDLNAQESEWLLLYRDLPPSEQERQLEYLRWLSERAEDFAERAAYDLAISRLRAA